MAHRPPMGSGHDFTVMMLCALGTIAGVALLVIIAAFILG